MFRTTIAFIAFQCFMSVSGDISDEFLINLFAEVCPRVDICEQNATSAELKPNEYVDGSNRISCCKGCSCHPDCRDHMNCCHGQHITDADVHKHNPVCTHMSVGSPGQKFGAHVPAFYTIVSEPVGGCIIDKPFETKSGGTFLPSCVSQPVTPWGDFYPVLSKTSNKIYKNEACALCHGVNDSDPFTPYLECDKVTLDRTHTYHLSEYLQVFENNEMLEICQIEYRHTYLPVLRPQRCLVDMVTNCKLDDIAPTSDKQFSDNLTSLACEDGFYAPVASGDVGYKNIFCAVCNGDLKSLTEHFCWHDSFIWRNFGDKTKFTLLLDSRFIKPPQTTLEEDRTFYPEVCLVNDSTPSETMCRKLLCPSGMVRRQGVCDFISKNWFTSGLAIDVRLKLTSGNLPGSGDDIEPFCDEIVRNNPWQGRLKWTVAAVFYKLQGGLSENLFIVYLVATSDTFVVYDWMNSIKKTLSKSWIAIVNGSHYYFDQSILEYTPKSDTDLDIVTPLWKQALKSTPDHSYNRFDDEIWKRRRYPSNDIAAARYYLQITNLYFCEQIELPANEFDIELSTFVIKHKLDGRFFFDREFILMKKETGSQAARVCFSDTPFWMSTSSCAVCSIARHASVTVFVFTLVKLYR